MDILDHIADYIRAELGDDIFTEQKREFFLLSFRMQYGKDRHYVYSTAAKTETDRIAAIFKAFREGLPSREIAERVGCTHRRVNQILSTVKMPGNPVP